MELNILLIFTSLLAGAITVFAPCIFTFLPIILASSVETTNNKNKYRKSLIIISSLGISVLIFSIILKASTLLINIDQRYWELLAGIIILTQGILILFPHTWDKISTKLKLTDSTKLLNRSQKTNTDLGYILTGVSLGPVFSSCSPTYGFIIGILLQSTFSFGLIYLICYIIGLCLIVVLISILGQRLIQRLRWSINPKGLLKRSVGVIFILKIGRASCRERV